MNLIAFISDFYAAYSAGQVDALPISDTIIHVSPMGTVEGRDAFASNCMAFAPMIERIDVLNHIESDNQICVEVLSVSKFGSKPMSEWFTIDEGVITKMVSYFDASDLKAENTESLS